MKKTRRAKNGNLRRGLRRKAARRWTRKGTLKDSIDYYATSSKVMVGSNLPYARIHQKGGRTSPHVIRPKRKKALAFGGIVRKKVNHPGSDIPARPYLGISDDDREEIMDTMTDFLEGAFK